MFIYIYIYIYVVFLCRADVCRPLFRSKQRCPNPEEHFLIKKETSTPKAVHSTFKICRCVLVAELLLGLGPHCLLLSPSPLRGIRKGGSDPNKPLKLCVFNI